MKVATFVFRTRKEAEKQADEHMVGLKFYPHYKIDYHAQRGIERSALCEKRFDDFVDIFYTSAFTQEGKVSTSNRGRFR